MEADEPEFVVVDDANVEIYSNYLEVVQLFMSYRQLYSWEYLNLMRSQLNFAGKYRINIVRAFLDIISHRNCAFTTLTLRSAFDRFMDDLKAGSLEQVQENAQALLKELALHIDVLLSYLEVAVAIKGTSIVVEYHNKGAVFRTYDQLLAFIAAEEKVKKQEIEEARRKEREHLEKLNEQEKQLRL